MPTAAVAKTLPEPRTVLISNRVTWVDTPVVTSPFPALDEIDQLTPVQRRPGDEPQPRFPGGAAICVPTSFGDCPDKIHASCKN